MTNTISLHGKGTIPKRLWEHALTGMALATAAGTAWFIGFAPFHQTHNKNELELLIRQGKYHLAEPLFEELHNDLTIDNARAIQGQLLYEAFDRALEQQRYEVALSRASVLNARNLIPDGELAFLQRRFGPGESNIYNTIIQAQEELTEFQRIAQSEEREIDPDVLRSLEKSVQTFCEYYLTNFEDGQNQIAVAEIYVNNRILQFTKGLQEQSFVEKYLALRELNYVLEEHANPAIQITQSTEEIIPELGSQYFTISSRLSRRYNSQEGDDSMMYPIDIEQGMHVRVTDRRIISQDGRYREERDQAFPPGTIGVVEDYGQRRVYVRFDSSIETRWTQNWTNQGYSTNNQPHVAKYDPSELELLVFRASPAMFQHEIERAQTILSSYTIN